MRNNQPVTTNERLLEPGKPIVTKTDTKGLITYANESFVRVSGFSREQLIGQPHNIVRHPDMPPEAFADLWRTLKAGSPWRGLVKNRSANGDFYWVDAYVTPETQGGQVVGYQSVRTAPTRQQIAEAEALYAAVRSGRTAFPATPLPDTRALLQNLQWIAPVLIALPAIGAALMGGTGGRIWAALAALLALGLGAWNANYMKSTIARLRVAVSKLDEGVLHEPVATPRGPFLQVFSGLESMRIHLRAMFADVLLSAREVEQQSGELDTAMQRFVDESQHQSAQIMQAAAAMEEMSVAINELSENNKLAFDAVENTRASAGLGMHDMHASIASCQQVEGVTQDARERIAEVNAAVSHISQITGVIRGIADQTNLLALNAAIEAARAGDEGRGFAVVADEVRGLAERTAASTSEIHDAITAIVARAGTAVESMAVVSQGIADNTRDIQNSSTRLEQIHQASEDAAKASGEIASMLQQQSTASHEFASSMERLSASLESSAATVSSVGQSSAEMRNTSTGLMQLIRHLESALR